MQTVLSIVVKLVNGELEYPGPGYYPLAHAGVTDPDQLLVLWGRELEAVQRTRYPDRV